MSNVLTKWVRCPKCGGDDVDILYNNGRLNFMCMSKDCYHSTSKLVGKHTFR